MTIRFAILIAALSAAPLAAQPAEAPRGTYLVYVEESGAAFVSREPSLVEAGVWPLEFHYFENGETIGTARMSGRADCALGMVRGRLTHVNGAPIPQAESLAAPQFTFDSAAAEAGDPAIVNFICSPANATAPADMPIARGIGATVDLYRALTMLGLSPDIAARLSVRDAEAAAALAGTLVADDRQAAVLEALGAERD
ncbi:MAG: hypothetical protein LC634_03730 [Sphingomonadales bacterium]|nr:hypothetical protein [Sphingomonadales bacterium]